MGKKTPPADENRLKMSAKISRRLDEIRQADLSQLADSDAATVLRGALATLEKCETELRKARRETPEGRLEYEDCRDALRVAKIDYNRAKTAAIKAGLLGTPAIWEWQTRTGVLSAYGANRPRKRRGVALDVRGPVDVADLWIGYYAGQLQAAGHSLDETKGALRRKLNRPSGIETWEDKESVKKIKLSEHKWPMGFGDAEDSEKVASYRAMVRKRIKTKQNLGQQLQKLGISFLPTDEIKAINLRCAGPRSENLDRWNRTTKKWERKQATSGTEARKA